MGGWLLVLRCLRPCPCAVLESSYTRATDRSRGARSNEKMAPSPLGDRAVRMRLRDDTGRERVRKREKFDCVGAIQNTVSVPKTINKHKAVKRAGTRSCNRIENAAAVASPPSYSHTTVEKYRATRDRQTEERQQRDTYRIHVVNQTSREARIVKQRAQRCTQSTFSAAS